MSDAHYDFVSDLSDSQIDKEWTVDDFSIAQCLGKGQFGKVYLAKETRTAFNYIVALKIISKTNMIETECERTVEKELRILKKCNHPNIVRCYGFFHNETNIYYILEYCPNGNLYTAIETNPLDEVTAATYIHQISKAIEYLHSYQIIHRDIKPENILIGFWGEAKLADFGWATDLRERKFTKTVCGTLDYLCPEILSGQPYNYKVDIWCLGVLCYELLVKCPPFLATSNKETHRLIKSVIFTVPDRISMEATQLIKKLLVKDPEQRLTASGIIKDAWIKKHAEVNKE